MRLNQLEREGIRHIWSAESANGNDWLSMPPFALGFSLCETVIRTRLGNMGRAPSHRG